MSVIDKRASPKRYAGNCECGRRVVTIAKRTSGANVAAPMRIRCSACRNIVLAENEPVPEGVDDE